ncbi:hypothetical protein ALC62_09126 [Cyphomyrmex costatus]|uniref:Uncharacterized protein n=1 Tax=Cyphomyrmex costatus TaxID=456900 RepID=A0A195CJ20_9HYME|nr:hypothetical protein ALC62_09126 [Cyphomyrmex costatus]
MLRDFIFSPSHTANVSRRRRSGKCGQSLAKDNRRANGGTDIGALATVNSPGNCRRGETHGGGVVEEHNGQRVYSAHTRDSGLSRCFASRNSVMVTFGFRKIVQADSVPRETREKLRLARRPYIHLLVTKVFPEYTTSFPRDSPFRCCGEVSQIGLFACETDLPCYRIAKGFSSLPKKNHDVVLGVSGSTGLGYPRTDLSSSSSFRRARRRASLREPQQQCSAVVQSRECAMDVAERMLRSRGEKGDCGAGNKEGSLGAIPTTARIAHHLINTIDVRDHQEWSGDRVMDTDRLRRPFKIRVTRAFLSTPHCIFNSPNPYSISCICTFIRQRR